MLNGVQDQEMVGVRQGKAALITRIEEVHHQRQQVKRAVVELEDRRFHRPPMYVKGGVGSPWVRCESEKGWSDVCFDLPTPHKLPSFPRPHL
jgi:hypothetical protein